MSAMASQITGVLIVCSTICSGADCRKHQSFMSLAFVRGIHRWPVDSLHKDPVTQKITIHTPYLIHVGMPFVSSRSDLCCTVVHYNDVIMSPMASQITSLMTVYSTVYSEADQRIYQSSVSLVDSLHKGPVTRKMFPCDDVIRNLSPSYHNTYSILYAWGYAFCEFKAWSVLYCCHCCYIYIQYHKCAGSVMRQGFTK